MKLALSLLLNRAIPRAEFQGTESELRVYEAAVRMLKAARFLSLSRVFYRSALLGYGRRA